MRILAHLIAVILAFIAESWRQDRVAARLFAPYAVWVAFASVLNASIFALN
jgi:translocator protein